MLIGYARISTQDQNLALQRDALTQACCEKIFTDVASGGEASRAGLADALAHCRTGDTLIVWKLDRLGRSLKHLIETVTTLQARGIGFRSITEGIETETSGGRPALLDEKKIATARRMHADPANSAADIARALGVSRATLYRALKLELTPRPASGILHQAVKRGIDVPC